MTTVSYDREAVQKSLREKISRAAAKAISEGDVWSKYAIEAIPAERVVRHRYNPETRQFMKDETIVKMEKKPFTHGAMRHCFRMKKLASLPQSASNHRFHSYGWSRASNYVAKWYMRRGRIDTSAEGIDAVLTDITLQYEAMHWAEKFNETQAPKKVDFIRAYAVCFVDRPGKPMFAVERFIAGTDSYGLGFLKHNANSGFVDLEEHRKTPQVFSAHTFYASQGQRLVADVQGVGDLYTDPQVLSMDYRFGDGDLGPRGMALFFKTFRHCDISDKLGIPIFPLSRNEKRHQAKYNDEESTLSEEMSALEDDMKCRFRKLDANRQQRKSVLMRPTDIQCDHSVDTARRSNISDMSKTIQKSMRQLKMSTPSVIHRTKSDVDEISSSLGMGLTDAIFDHHAFHRFESGEIKPRHVRTEFPEKNGDKSEGRRVKGMKRGTVFAKSMMKVTAPPMNVTAETKSNLGRVHYHLACLHGMDRFPEIVPDTHGGNVEDKPSHDIFSVIFHLCHAASLYDVPACLALARARVGLDTYVSPLLKSNVTIDFESSKEFCRRAMASERSNAAPKVAAGCLLYQIIEDEGTAGDVEKMNILEETLNMMKLTVEEAEIMKEHTNKQSRGKAEGFHVGDKVEGNYFMEGSFYPGVVVEVGKDGNSLAIQYDDDGSTETLSNENVRSLEPASEILAAQTARLSDEEALGTVNTDEQCMFEEYDLMAKLAKLRAKTGEYSDAAALFQEAADLAMNAGKMKTANSWSMRAAELEG
mmetsp:Transcript_26278/g.56418  ORF Transcript_26278/g.56418 Transcript_26278/m.56418 type:complete len:758 (-) Transcript_26278:98-2371(-)|eukprot:CAMPEP_0172315298 /NCGR_PEP_ID=MMETSP1058-20130122/24778_1 /TAXON_ID=83371 /ORGANISM="Detonula confervacea, Strain CCMP 353" /LENGTH=757 /DNA_ID=CAMNT_0013029353 /DNA_START=89 /DNA_END=2362 /DNA_ORIENTATION=-